MITLAVLDTLIGTVASGIASALTPGTRVIILNAAAPFGGHLHERPGLTDFVPTRAIRLTDGPQQGCRTAPAEGRPALGRTLRRNAPLTKKSFIVSTTSRQ